MRASYGWLCELVGAGFAAPPTELADRLTRAGLEVEALTPYGEACPHVKVACVLATEPHPARAKLTLVTVDAGGPPQRVVCGAGNVPEPGGLVVLAPLGTHLPAKGLTLEPKDIAGVISEGMLCSESELGLRVATGDKEGGILVLPKGLAAPGTTLASAIAESSDVVLEIGLTPNRPDGLGHLGLAREIAALYGRSFRHAPPRPARVQPGLRAAQAVSVHVEDPARCPTYGAAVVDGVSVGPSPLGVQYRLEALGIRAISNVVDATNLILMKYGHPIHAFDRDRVGGGSIIVRRAAEGERLATLDGVARTLTTDDLVIADASAPVALAGVMGGAGTEISASTKRVLIECATFAPRGVRRTARRYGMHSESSHRFERGVDTGDTDDVLAESAHLLVELAGGTAGEEVAIHGPGVPPPAPIPLRRDRMRALLGVTIPMAEAKRILELLGCRETTGAPPDAAEALAFLPPTHRPDLTIEVDLIEEVVRVFGIDRVPSVVPAIRAGDPHKPDLEARVVRAALEVGLSQALTFGFTSAALLRAVRAPEPQFVLSNPLGEERAAMRTSLLPGLLEAVRRARRHGVSDVRLFATGARFLPAADGGELPLEAKTFAAAIAGRRDAVLAKPELVDVYDAKGVALAVVERALGRSAVAERAPADASPHLHPRASAVVRCEGVAVGTFGVLHPAVERALDLDGPCLVVELDLDALERLGPKTPRYRPIPTLPATTRDISVTVHEDVPAGEVERAIAEVGGPLVETATVFDLFRGGALPPDHRSLAFHVVYRDPLAATAPERARTLTDVEVDERHAAVVKAIGERFGAELRG